MVKNITEPFRKEMCFIGRFIDDDYVIRRIKLNIYINEIPDEEIDAALKIAAENEYYYRYEDKYNENH